MGPVCRGYFSSEFYFYETDFMISVFDKPEKDEVWEISEEYHKEYVLLLELLRDFRYRIKAKNITIYGSSRIIDELNMDLKPLDDLGERLYRHIRMNYLPHFIDYQFIKIAYKELSNKYLECKGEFSGVRKEERKKKYEKKTRARNKERLKEWKSKLKKY